MRLLYNFIVFILIILCLSCNRKSNENDTNIYNGIDSQILNIIDSMQIDFIKFPFVTIEFYSINDSNYVRFINSILIPISKDYSIMNYLKEYTGYKILDSEKCLMFLNNTKDTIFNNFVKTDSLSMDEKKIEYFKKKYDVYRYKKNANLREIYFYINKNDSLVFIKYENI